MSETIEIRLDSGVMGRIWEASGKFCFAHPNGSEGSDYESFDAAERALNEADKIKLQD